MAEGNEQLTLHTESIDTVVDTLRDDGHDTIANTIEAQR